MRDLLAGPYAGLVIIGVPTLVAIALCVIAVRSFRRASSGDYPKVVRYIVLGLKWTIAAFGLYMMLGLAYEEHQEGRVGLGTGFVVAALAAVIEGGRRYWKQRHAA